jgi:integrase
MCFPEILGVPSVKLDAKIAAVAALPAGRTDHFIWDDELAGFGLRLRVGGHRSWITQYRTASGRTRRLSLGSTAKLTAAQARDAARKVLAKVELGGDPQGEREEHRHKAAGTFQSVVDSYLAAREPELRPTSFRITKLYLIGPYFRPLHSMALTAIKRSDIAATTRSIATKHSTPTAAAARRALSAFFAWAIADGLLGDGANPVDGSHRPDDPTPRDRVLSNAELVAIRKACDDDEFGKIVRLLILLGSRRQEVGGMCWSELDLDVGIWTLPKTRSKNHREHKIALPSAALSILASVPRTDRDHLFGERADDGFTGWSNAKRDLDRRLGRAVKTWRIHDLRRSTATKMADIGIEPHIIEATLNHYSGHRAGVAGIYNRSNYERAVAAALSRWSEHVLALVEGREGKIVALPQRA